MPLAQSFLNAKQIRGVYLDGGGSVRDQPQALRHEH